MKIILMVLCMALGISSVESCEVFLEVKRRNNEGLIVVSIMNNSDVSWEVIDPKYSLQLEIWHRGSGLRVRSEDYLKIVDEGGFVPIEKVVIAGGQSVEVEVNIRDFSSLDQEADLKYEQLLEKALDMRLGLELVAKIDLFKEGEDHSEVAISRSIELGIGQHKLDKEDPAILPREIDR